MTYYALASWLYRRSVQQGMPRGGQSWYACLAEVRAMPHDRLSQIRRRHD